MTRAHLSLLAALALGALSASRLHAEDTAVPVLVETADGSVLAGKVAASAEVVLVDGAARTKLALRDVRRVCISSVREKETKALEAEVKALRDRLADDDAKVREAASTALHALPGSAAPFLARLAKDSDPEVVLRAKAVIAALAAKGELRDPRDLVVVKKRLLRGWLELEKLELETDMGTVALHRDELRMLRSPKAPADADAELGDDDWLPPMAHAPAKLPLQVVAVLSNGSRLVGLVAAEALALADAEGKKLCSDRLVCLARDEEARELFVVHREGVPPFKAALAAKEVPITCSGRTFQVPAASIESLTVGPPGGDAKGSLIELVRRFVTARAQGVETPAERFWVHINNQPANPWNSQGKGMTWSLLDVKGKVALVGADKKTDAYHGDTPVAETLPILCVKKGKLAAPEGVDAKDFYNGWSGSELRLSKPVAGKKLESLEAANALIKAEHGEGWEMAEFHSPHGGWHWWGYWTAPAKEDR